MKTKDLGMAESSDQLAAMSARKSVRRVIHQLQTAFASDRVQRFDVASAPPKMNGKNPGCARRDEFFDL